MVTGTLTDAPVWETQTLSLKRPTDPPGLATAVEGIGADADHIYATLYHVDVNEPKKSLAPGHLVVLKAATGEEVARIEVGHQPRHVAVDPLRNRAYVVNYHQDSYSVSIVDTKERAVRKTISLGFVPLRVAVSPERNRAYVSNHSGKIQVISGPGANGTGDALLTEIAVGKGATGICVDDAADRVYATTVLIENGTTTMQVVPINGLTHAVGVPTTIPPLRSDPEDVVADPISGHVFVANLGNGGPSPEITVLDRNLQIIDHIPLHRDASHLAFDPKTRQVYADTPDGVAVIDAVARKVTSLIPTPPNPRGVAAAAIGPRVFIGDTLGGRLTIATPIGAGPHDLTLTRPDDLLQLDFDFVNLRVDAGPGRPAKLVRVDANAPALIIVTFPPQHLAERAFSFGEPPPTVFRPAQARLAGATRLAFRLPSGLNEILYTVESLLDWKRFEPSLVPAALPRNPTAAETIPPPPIAEPGAAQTAIEMPYRLLMSPDRTAVWEHASKPVTHRGRTELWHTRLRVKDQPQVDPALRAVWSPDFPANTPAPFPIDASITPAQRREIVRLTSDFTLGAATRPVTAEQFMLTPLGGYIKARGSWKPPAGLSVGAWRHLATLGRDHNVRVDVAGVLLPFGHRAIQVTASEREILPAAPNAGTTPRPAAVLRKRSFVVIAEAEKRFDGPEALSNFTNKGREMPLSSVKILLHTTPDLDTTSPLGTPGAFWLRTKTPLADLQIPVAVTDAAGRTTEVTMPMAFVPNNVVNSPVGMLVAQNAYSSETTPQGTPRRAAAVAGQGIAYAPPASPTSEDTTLATERILFDTQRSVPVGVNGDAPFLPLIQEVAARIPAVEAVTGAVGAVEVKFFDRYLAGALQGAGNQAGVFMSFKQAIPTSFTPETAGGLARTALEFTGVSRTAGAVASDLTKLADGILDDLDIKKPIPANARLLGTIPLQDILAAGFDLKKVPKLLNETVRNAAGVPETLVARLDWQPAIKDFGPFKARRITGSGGATTAATMAIKTRIEQKLPQGVPAGPPTPPTYSVEGTLKDFSIAFLEILTINFASLTFQSRSGEKTSVKPALAPPSSVAGAGPVVFRKELNFLDELRKQIPPGVLGDLPKLDVTAQGVEIGYSLALPPLAFGAFTLQNVILDGGLSLPFDDRAAAVRFSFGTRNNPFNLSVLAIGGGGHLGIEVAMDRIVAIEAALEMGGNAAVNLGVARAAVWIMGGIYFKLAEGPDGEAARVELTAYLRYGGSVSVLGLVGVSIEVYLGLTYDAQQNLLHGQAKVTAKAKIAFFTKTVTFKVERTIEGPSLLDGAASAAARARPRRRRGLLRRHLRRGPLAAVCGGLRLAAGQRTPVGVGAGLKPVRGPAGPSPRRG